MFGAAASRNCPEWSPEPPVEDHRSDVECVWCREKAEPGDAVQFANGDVVCGDCLRDYLEAMGDSYYGAYAASQPDFIRWWAKDYISLNCLLGLLQEAFEQYPMAYRQQARAAFALDSGQEFREYVQERMGGVPLV